MASPKSNIKQPQPKRGQIKIKIFKMFAKSLQNLASGLAGKDKKVAGKDMKVAGKDKKVAGNVIKKNQPIRRGQIKVKIFKMVYRSIKNFGNGFAGSKKKDAGDGCFSSPAAVTPADVTPLDLNPVEIVGELRSIRESKKGQIKIEIKIGKTIDGSVIEVSKSGGETKGAGGGRLGMAGVFGMEL